MTNKAKAKSEDAAPYKVDAPSPTKGKIQLEQEEEVIALALSILERRVKEGAIRFDSPQAVRTYLQVRHANKPDQFREVFTVLFLSSQNEVMATEDMFVGSLTQTSVYPREVVRAALKHNAAAVVFAHNHPSGVAEPSRADEVLTQTLKASLAQVDVRVLDHFIVTTTRVVSMAEMGLV